MTRLIENQVNSKFSDFTDLQQKVREKDLLNETHRANLQLFLCATLHIEFLLNYQLHKNKTGCSYILDALPGETSPPPDPPSQVIWSNVLYSKERWNSKLWQACRKWGKVGEMTPVGKSYEWLFVVDDGRNDGVDHLAVEHLTPFDHPEAVDNVEIDVTLNHFID